MNTYSSMLRTPCGRRVCTVSDGDRLYAGNLMPTLNMRLTSQALYRAHALLEGGQRHVTIADLTQGVVHPSKVGGGCSCL